MAVVLPDADGPIITYQGSRPSASRPLRPSFEPFSAETAFWNSACMAASSACRSGRIPSPPPAASFCPFSMADAAFCEASTLIMTYAARPSTITAVTTMAGHMGSTFRNTRTAAQLRAMKIPPKMYFNTSSPHPSLVELLDPVLQLPDLMIDRDAQADEYGAGHREHAQRDPQDRGALARADQRLDRGLARRRQVVGNLDVTVHLGPDRVDDAQQLDLAPAHGVLALKPEQQALVVDAQHVQAPRVAPDLLQPV